jgi:hypothetical protein
MRTANEITANSAFWVVYHNISCLLVSPLIELVFSNYCFQGFSVNTWLQHAATPALLSPPPEHQKAGFVEMPIGGVGRVHHQLWTN